MSEVLKWLGPNPNRQVKQISFRPAVHIAAKLATLEELFPNRNRTEIINDMLDQAFGIIEDQIKDIGGHDIAPNEEGFEVKHYRDLSFWEKYLEVLEKNQKVFQAQASGTDE